MPGRHGGTLTAPGLCGYCQLPTKALCRMCMRPICPDHTMDDDPGVCVECGSGPSQE